MPKFCLDQGGLTSDRETPRDNKNDILLKSRQDFFCKIKYQSHSLTKMCVSICQKDNPLYLHTQDSIFTLLILLTITPIGQLPLEVFLHKRFHLMGTSYNTSLYTLVTKAIKNLGTVNSNKHCLNNRRQDYNKVLITLLVRLVQILMRTLINCPSHECLNRNNIWEIQIYQHP